MTMRYQSPNDDNPMIDARAEAAGFGANAASGEMPRGDMNASAAVALDGGEMPSGQMTGGSTAAPRATQTETITLPGVWRLTFVKGEE